MFLNIVWAYSRDNYKLLVYKALDWEHPVKVYAHIWYIVNSYTVCIYILDYISEPTYVCLYIPFIYCLFVYLCTYQWLLFRTKVSQLLRM